MAKQASKPVMGLSPTLARLVEQGRVRPPRLRLSEALAERGELEGPVSDAGSRALQEQRGERA